MSLKLKLTGIILAIVAIVILILTVIILTQSSRLQTTTAYLYADALAGEHAQELSRAIEVFTSYASVLSEVFGEFESTPENIRRSNYNDFLQSMMLANTSIIGMWTAWLPNTIDRFDAQLGQYQTFFSRQSGTIERVEEGYEGWQNYLANIAEKPIMATPVWRDVHGLGRVGIISAIFPIKDSRGRNVGLIGINYVSNMQYTVNTIVKELYDGQGIAAIYSNDGTIVAHYVTDRIGTNISTNEAERSLLGEEHARIVQAIRNGGEDGEAVTVDRFSPVFNTYLHLIYFPVTINGIDTPWNLMVGIPKNVIDKPINDLIFITIIFAIIILLVSAVITYMLASSIVKPIANVTNTLKDISEGEGDLTKRIDNKSNDEVGQLSLYFNHTLDKIKNLVISIKIEANKLNDIGADLASNMNETAAAINQITANIQSIKGRVINQSASVSETHATMDQVSGNINKLNSQVENQTSHISQASAAIEEMVANIQSVTDTLVKNTVNVKTLKDASEVGRTGLQDVASDIQEIARESEGLLEINSVMENIASQTNLLSMNAAIEAAHAGEAGKGFAVVADEIRKLAEGSSEQSKTISSVLKKIKDSIDKITISTDNVLNKFEAIDSGVRIVSEQEDIIRNAMEEQGQGSKQVLEGIGQVNDITRQVKSGSNEMLSGASEVIRESENLEKVTQEITAGMNEMASGADQINVAVHHVNEISTKNRDGIDTLMKEVSKFKVD